ncbi:MAG: hypothetical protein LBO20_02620 [Bifidobacteriaceae bacterium]|jgi:hypothetical protein|nr:hypothetical protein [Bifidobacteriaceae bacterium]
MDFRKKVAKLRGSAAGRPARAGAAGSDVKPVVLRMVFDGEDGLVEVEDPARGEVAERIGALGEAKRWRVALFRDGEKSRLDVCGAVFADGERGLLVFFTVKDGRRELVFQPVETDPATIDEADAVDGVFAGDQGAYPRQRIVTAQAALAAARWFCDNGGRDPELTWDQESRGHEIVKPPSLDGIS